MTYAEVVETYEKTNDFDALVAFAKGLTEEEKAHLRTFFKVQKMISKAILNWSY